MKNVQMLLLNPHRTTASAAGKLLLRTAAGLICSLLLMTFRAPGAWAQGKEDAGLEQVLKQMEAVGKTFRTFAARISRKNYTAVLREFDTPRTGDFFYSRAKDGSALLRQDLAVPAKEILTIRGGFATIYQPEIKQAQIYNLGKNKDKAEYLALGIGQSPARLQEAFDLKYQGAESVNGTPCSVLLLKPKNPAAAAFFSAITLWIKRSSGIPIQQKLQEPSGDYLLVSFSEEKLNTKIPESKFELKLPNGVEILRIQ